MMSAGGGRQDAGDGPGKRRFSAAGFADDAEIAAPFHRQADGIDRANERQTVGLDGAVAGDRCSISEAASSRFR
jgi:hypothetical protein